MYTLGFEVLALNPFPMQFHLAPDPASWGSDILTAELDDALHDPRNDHNSHNLCTARGLQNLGSLFLLCLIILGILCVAIRSVLCLLHSGSTPLSLGYPLTQHFTSKSPTGGPTVLHVNATGQIPNMGNFRLIDLDTPKVCWACVKLINFTLT